MELKNLDLLSLQTNQMKNDNTTQAMCQALNGSLREVVEKIPLCTIRTQIDNLPEHILDEIALSKNIFWYDAKANIIVKRNLIKSSEKVFRYLGTNYAIEQVIKDYFSDGEIQEWYEYGGDPFHFRVLTSNAKVNGELADQFNNAVEKVKRKSTRLQEVIVMMSNSFNLNMGFVLHTGDTITLRQEG